MWLICESSSVTGAYDCLSGRTRAWCCGRSTSYQHVAERTLSQEVTAKSPLSNVVGQFVAAIQGVDVAKKHTKIAFGSEPSRE